VQDGDYVSEVYIPISQLVQNAREKFEIVPGGQIVHNDKPE
jgi:hypothetical protein